MDPGLIGLWALVGWCGTPYPRWWWRIPPPPDPEPWWRSRLIGVVATALWLCWSRNILGCLASGMIAYSLARVLL